jgi:Integrase core domain
MAVLKIPIHTHPFTTSVYTPMERLNMDYIGPFPDGGYILVIICCFTRWVELFLTDDATSTAASKCLFQHFGRFGAPAQLLADRGTHFVNAVIQEFLALVGSEQILTLSYSKEENAIVERENKEINRHITALTFDKRIINNYRDCIPMVQRIINASEHSKLQASPADLLFGTMVNLDRALFLPREHVTKVHDQPLSAHADRMLMLQARLVSIAQKIQQAADQKHITDAAADRTEFADGSYVLVRYPTQPPTRLHTPWKGPLQVIQHSGNEYVLRDLIEHTERTYHVTQLKQFEYDPEFTDPREVAMHEAQEFEIEAVTSYRGDRYGSRKDLEFEVKFKDGDIQWLPYSEIKRTDALHAYLRAHRMTSLIPQDCK